MQSIDGALQPQIEWLERSVRRRRKFDVSDVFTHRSVSPSDRTRVIVVDRKSTTKTVYRASDRTLCAACAVLLNTNKRHVSLRVDVNIQCM